MVAIGVTNQSGYNFSLQRDFDPIHVTASAKSYSDFEDCAGNDHYLLSKLVVQL